MKHRSPSPRRREVPVTPLILRGRWESSRFPGNDCFVENCRTLARAYAVHVPRRRHAPVVALFSVVERESEILDTLSQVRDKIVTLLLRIASYSERWVRPVDDWSPATECGPNQLSELVRYLFESYPTPTFFEAAWRRRRERRPRALSRVDWAAFDWYVHVAGGGNIRTAPGLPVTLSPRAAHELGTAPGDLLPRDALRWAQIRAAGVPTRLVRAVLASSAATEWEREPRWVTLFQKLGTDPALGPEQVGPLFDYVRHRLRDGERAFSIKGRTLASLLEAMRRWHAELATQRYAYTFLRVPPAEARWSALSGASSYAEGRGDESWELSELVCFHELFDEGRTMHHCVATYASACLSGYASIWSLRIRTPERESGRVTIRVEVPTRRVVEARAVSNQAITREQHRFIEKWARLNRLEVAETIPLCRE